MSITFACPFCRKPFTVSDGLAGKKARCKQCGSEFRVPTPSKTTAALDVDDPYGLSEPSPQAPVRPTRSRSDELFDDVRSSAPATPAVEEFTLPRAGYQEKPKKKKRKPGMPVGEHGGALALVVLLVIGGLVGVAFTSRAAAAISIVILGITALPIILIGSIWSLIVPFKEGVFNGLAYLLVPFYSLYYAFTRWEDMKGPFSTFFAGWMLLFLSFFITEATGIAAASRAKRAGPQADAGAFGAAPRAPGRAAPWRGGNNLAPRWPIQAINPGEQAIIDELGERALIIQITGLPPVDDHNEISAEVTKRIAAAVPGHVPVTSVRNGVMRAVVGPVDDPTAVATRLMLGRLTAIGPGHIDLILDLDTLLLTRAAPADGDAITRSLAELKLPNQFKRREAIERLTRQDLNTPRREEVVRALEQQTRDNDQFTRNAAIKALGTWGTADSVPILIALLANDNPSTRDEAIKALAELKDPRAIEPIAQQFVAQRGKVVDALTAFGPEAESAVRKYLRHPNVFVRADAAKLLGVIGTKASVPGLRALLREGSIPGMAAQEALQKIGTASR